MTRNRTARQSRPNRQRGSRNVGPAPRSGGRGGGQSANLYASLASDGYGNGFAGGEMNAHLAERFTSARGGSDDPYPDPEHVPLSVPRRTNNDIWEYYQNADEDIATAGAWLDKTEIPNPSEVLSAPSGFAIGEQIINLGEELRPNKIDEAYEDNEDYLRTQYELLREDAIRPLREAVEEVRRDPWQDETDYTNNIGIYEPVYITAFVFSPRGLAARVAFSLSRVKKFILWKQSKRLITGSLVALSPADDAFQSKCILATIAARPLSGLQAANPPEIDLFFARTEDIEIDPMKKWIMVECRSSFYEASRHTLLALQHLRREPFPMREHIVQAKIQVEPPSYLLDNPFTDMSSLVSMEESEQFQNVNILQTWPSSETHSLDKSQSRALKRILTNRLAIVQGPPGTGKTYVSVVALRILLANLRKEDPPIIVTCQTNHALDQLLRHVAEFEPNFIRLGGRSKDKDKIKKRTLFEVRSTYSQPKIPGSRKNKSMGAIKQLTNKMQMLLAPLEMGKGCLDHGLLVKLGLITEKQAESLELEAQFAMGISQDTPGIQMEQWLSKSLVPCRRPIQPDDFGMDYEEEDFDQVEDLEEMEAETVARDDDDDIEALKGPVTPLSDNYTGKGGYLRGDEEIRDLLSKTSDLTTIPVPDRGCIYKYFQKQTKRLILHEFRQLAKEYDKLVLNRKIGQWEQDQGLLLDQRLIGMTTTGLSKYRALIASLRPRIVLVEEAAETLEAPVTAACVPSLEHLILVGDHQQLRPHCQVHELEDAPYYFNLSLFERMVINDIDIDCLKSQRRMIPEVRRLLAPIYGNTLKDHSSVANVSNRPAVEGMGGCNSYFFTHEWLESKDHNMSTLNEKEADMIVGFVDYLTLNGVESRKITLLTFYNGQRSLLQKKLRFHPNLRDQPFNVVTVDSYQGEENDIVLLSLVRSNKRRNIGFLSVDNRVCVALSRARRGFYIFGNAEMLACESGTWAHVINIMYGKGNHKDLPATQPRRIGYQFPLECVNHQHKLWIEEPSDWEEINGGCDVRCGCDLSCGHQCVLRCHPFESNRINCTQKCNKRVPGCGHPCGAMCCDACKCLRCDQRNNGIKTMLKPANANGTSAYRTAMSPPNAQMPAASVRMGTFGPQDGLLDFPSQASAPPADPSSATDDSGSTPHDWKAYANGGAKADDAQMRQKQQQEDEKFYEMVANTQTAQPSAPAASSTKLIEISPKKRASTQQPQSQYLDQLGDLMIEPASPSKTRVRYTDTFSYASVAAQKTNKNEGKVNDTTTKTKETKPPPMNFNLLD